MKKILLITAIILVVCTGFLFIFDSHRNYVDFDDSMQTAAYQSIVSAGWGNQVMHIFRELYQKNNLRNIKPAKALKIPKIIHQIWLGSEFPEKYKAFQQSWVKHHPDWEYKLWQEADIANLVMQNRDLYQAARNYGEMSDIARYEILYQYGGLYVDTDYECLKPCDMFHYCYDFYIGIQPLDTNIVQLGIGLIGSTPKHPLLKAAIDGLPESDRQTQQIIAKTGPLYFTRVFCSHVLALPGINIAFPATYFYPRGYNQSFDDKTKWVKTESFAVHHWAGSWRAKEAFM